jgi:hypothetical protein
MAKAYYLPNGPKNLASLFPAIEFNNLAEYYLQVKADTVVIISTTMNVLEGCNSEDQVRIHFLNSAGTIDAINFKLLTIEHDPKSSSKESPVTFPLSKPDHAVGRFNVQANDIYTVCNTDYAEADMPWITELFDSPLAWMEWTGKQGQADSYLPIVITDTKIQSIKEEDRFVYEAKLQFKLSHGKSILR